MVSGEWGSGGIDLNLGTWGNTDEANFSTATSWFPYEQGWIGGWMNDPDINGVSTWASDASFSPQLESIDPNDVMVWADTFDLEDVFVEESGDFGAIGKLTLSELGVNSLSDGMLFTNSADGSSSTSITSAAPLPDGSGWQFAARQDRQENSDTVAAGDRASFSFVYIPYDANRLVGGHIDGDDASTIGGAGNFSVTRSDTGSYGIQIEGKTNEDGVLILSNADFLGDSTEIPDNNHLSYEWNPDTATFDVEARHFDGEVKLGDTDFYFMWVDFESPLTLEAGSDCESLAASRLAGDADGDGEVAFLDFLALANNFGTDAGYEGGDFDCNGEVAFLDFLALANNFGATAAANASAVPEPSGLALLSLAGLFASFVMPRRRKQVA